MVPFCISAPGGGFDGSLDLPQHLAAALRNSRSQDVRGCRGAEGIDRLEIIPVKPSFGVDTAPGQKQPGDTNGPCGLEFHLKPKIIIPFQQRTVNDVADFLSIVVPVVLHQFAGEICKLLGEVGITDPIGFRQHLGHWFPEAVIHLPEVRVQGVSAGAGIRHVKDIPQVRGAAAVIQQGDAFGAAPDKPVHPVVPDIILSAGGGIRALGINQQLVGIGVLVQPTCQR
ncbi:hypothetical protein [Faecalibacterium sp. An192]|uniref:hypothetical protein n=1 Tax=Faecalibacterium sp. An192 TaxID=1965581 RepID=UPI001FA8A58C|nr:hypothetical protein [Faecalibacterium sp. An192]